MDVPFFGVQLLDEVVIKVAAAMERERLHGSQRPWMTALPLQTCLQLWKFRNVLQNPLVNLLTICLCDMQHFEPLAHVTIAQILKGFFRQAQTLLQS